MFLSIILLFLLPFCLSSVFTMKVHTGCAGREDTEWNTHNPQYGLKSWLRSLVTVKEEEEGQEDIESLLYDPVSKYFFRHYTGYNDKVERDKEGQQMETNRRVVTIGRFSDGVFQGNVWQWRGRNEEEGWLYGKVDSKGRFNETKDIVFLYPDLKTGLLGRWKEDMMEEARMVEVVGEKCMNGIKEIQLSPLREDVWVGGEDLDPRVMDPYEEKSAKVSKSLIPEVGEGLFTKRVFLPGEVVSYLGGVRTYVNDFLLPNMTHAQMKEAAAYYFNLGHSSPKWWGLPRDLVIDMPVGMRSMDQYCITLGHKANCAWGEQANTKFGVMRHPILGVIGSLVALTRIEVGEEVTVNYNYNVDSAPGWYKQGYWTDLGRKASTRTGGLGKMVTKVKEWMREEL